MEGGYKVMSSIDNRIVKMSFDSSKFTGAANSAMGTLKKLGDSLKFTEGMKGLDGLAGKVKSVDMSPLSKGVDIVSSRFTALDVVAFTALQNITNNAMNAGKNLLHSLTLEPVMTGFNEYETKMNAITTIMTNTAHAGTTMDQVTATLNELNEYADLTIYNFAEMTRNIGTFTAAGVGLDDSATAIKGIANLAAASGSSSAQASTAMYQLSQALASGVVNLQDWNSVVNAGMGGKLFQDALKETGKAMGAIIDDTQSFRESISSKDGTGWLTSDILLETLKKFADDPAMLQAATQVKTFTQLIDTMKESVQSGWAMSWEHILGNKEEAAVLFTTISDGFNSIMGPMADYRNAALEFWKANGGRESIINGLSNVMKGFGKIIGPVYQAFKKIIDPWNGERMVSLSKSFEKFTSKLIISDKASAAIGKTFEGLFTIVKLLGLALKPIGAIFDVVTSLATPFVNAFVRILGALTGWASGGDTVEKMGNKISEVLSKVTGAAEKAADFLDGLFDKGLDGIGWAFQKVKPHLLEFADSAKDTASKWAVHAKDMMTNTKEFVIEHQLLEKAKDFAIDAFNGIQNGLQGFLNFLKDSVGKVRDLFGSIVDSVKAADLQTIDFVNAGLLASLLVVGKTIFNFIKQFAGSAGNLKDSAVGVLDSLSDTLQSYQKNIKAEAIKQIAIAIAILAGSVWVLSTIDPSKLIPAVASLAVLGGILSVAMKQFEKVNIEGVKKNTATMILLVGFATACTILASALRKIGQMKPMEMMQGLIGIGVMTAGIYAFSKQMENIKMDPQASKSIRSIAYSLIVLSAALAIIGNLDTSTLVKSITSITIILQVLVSFFKVVQKAGDPTKVAKAMIPLAISMSLLGAALAIIGNLDVSTIVKGMSTITVSLGVLAGFVKATSGLGADMLKIGGGIVLLSTALIILSGAIAIYGNMDLFTLAQGILVLSVVLSVLVTALNAMPKNVGSIGTQLSLLSVGMVALAGAMLMMSLIKMGTVVKSMVTLVGVLGILGGAATLFAAVAPAMLMVAGAVGILGVSMIALGGGLAILSVGMTMFAASIAASGVSIMGALSALIAVIPLAGAALALALTSFITIIGRNAEPIAKAFVEIVEHGVAALIANMPKLIDGFIVLMREVCRALIETVPDAVTCILVLINEVLKALIENFPSITAKLLELLSLFLVEVVGGLAVGLAQVGSTLIQGLVGLINIVLFEVLKGLATLTSTLIQGVFDLILGMLGEIESGIPKVMDAFTRLVLSILDALNQNVGTIVNGLCDFVIKMINTLTSTMANKGPELRAAVRGLIKEMINQFTGSISDFVGIGGDIIGGLVRGIGNGVAAVAEAARNVAKSALDSAKSFLGINSPSKEFEEVGMWSDEGLVGGLSKYSGKVEDAAIDVADGALSGMRTAMAGVSDIINEDISDQPVIKPVLDLSNIQNGGTAIDSMLSGDRAIKANVRNAQSVSANISRQSLAGLTGDTNNTNTTNNSTITNNFTVNGTNAKDIANEVSRILQKQVERRTAVWA